MEKELDPEVIKATQNSLGKYVKRPPLTEKLLKKPPFRFLHDIFTTVLKTTGFFEGLFDENELISENVKDRESKIVFLNKVIAVVGNTTGKTLTVKPSKIVAGQEPEKTNELLQFLAHALDSKLSSNDAVQSVKGGGKLPTDPKIKEIKSIKKTIDSRKLTSKSNEKLTNSKKDASDRSLTRNEKEKNNINKSKQKETQNNKVSPPKKPVVNVKTVSKKKSLETQERIHDEIDNGKSNKDALKNNTESDEDCSKDSKDQNNVQNETSDQSGSLVKESANVITEVQDLSIRTEQKDQITLNSTVTVAENDLNSSLSSQDLMEINDHDEVNNRNEKSKLLKQEKKILKLEKSRSIDNDDNKSQSSDSRPQSLTKDTSRNNVTKLQNEFAKTPNIDIAQQSNRPKTVRPSSSRPGAPRLREKHDIITGNENLLVGKVNIITEKTPSEEEEDNNTLILDDQIQKSSITLQQQDIQLSSNEHGALVQQILNSQKDLSQTSGKTDIEWQFGAQRAREAINQEVEQLRFNVQGLSRVANPLGKVLDHIQEDVEVMRQELQQWTKTYEDASNELLKQKTANEDYLHPIYTKLKQLDADIVEKRDKINDLKIIIHKNSLRIEKLLAGGADVQ